MRNPRRLLVVPLVLIPLALGCATRIDPRRPATPPPAFSHEAFDAVLDRFVDGHGDVDYDALAGDRGGLDAYYGELAAVSPRSHPRLFPSREEALAYWINAYNAAVLVTVLEHYPIDGVGDVPAPLALRPLLVFGQSRLAGFFYFQQVTLGGESMNLLDLENEIIRAFGEPRIHYAINCASRGCPPLSMEAFEGDRLEAQLDHAARRFFGEANALRIDHDTREVWLSSILDWFREDFDRDLLSEVRPHLPAERQAELDEARSYELRFIPYDWGLNRAGDPLRSGNVSMAAKISSARARSR